MEKKWFGIKVFIGYEQKVIDSLKTQIKKEKMENFISEIFLPNVEEYTYVRNVLKVKERYLYPGYIFVKMDDTNETVFFVRGIQYVTGYAGITSMKEKPSPMDEEEIDRMKEECQKIDICLNIGDKVTVVDHELYEGQDLKIFSIDTKNQTVELELKSLFGDDERTELFEFNQIKKVSKK